MRELVVGDMGDVTRGPGGWEVSVSVRGWRMGR